MNRAFTLIELILVMALLSIVIAIGAPSLSRFFHGQSLNDEGLRLLALTRLGQSRAVSEAMPVDLWFNTGNGTFGLKSERGKTLDFQLPQSLRFELVGDQTVIHFATDGSIADDSLPRVAIRHENGDSVIIEEAENHSSYVIAQNK